jgi:D-alanyl-D-alanine carboxypeptidase
MTGFRKAVMIWQRQVLSVIAFISFLLLPATAMASERRASMVLDANSGKILHAQAIDEPRYPASLTKLMTLYIVFEMMEQGRLSPSTRIRISPHAASVAPSKLGLDPGEEIALEDAIRIIVTKSANDIAVAVAERIAGTEPQFAALMTQKARHLGMSATTFRNANGLPDPKQVTTARDMITLALHLNDDFPRFYKYFSTRRFTYAGSTYRNHNTMLGWYQGMDGLKTGYTSASGFNLVASVRRGGKHVVGVVFGGSSAGARNAYMRAILDRALAHASTTVTRKPMMIAHQRQPAVVAAAASSREAPPLVEPVRSATPPLLPHQRLRMANAGASRQASRIGDVPRLPVVRVADNGIPRAEPAIPSSPPIEIARVRIRPVVIAPRQPRQAPMPREAPAPRMYDQQAPQEEAAVRPAWPPAPSRAEEAPVDAPPRPLAATPAAMTVPSGPIRGNPPSSLQAQAERLQRQEAMAMQPRASLGFATAAATRPPAPMAPPTAAGGFVVQIGAFLTENEAQRQLQAVQARSGGLLSQAQPFTQPVRSGDRQLYRARFAGFDSSRAASVCTELRRQHVDCLVLRGN